MINEVSQSPKTKTLRFYSHEGPGVVKSTEMEGRGGGGGLLTNGWGRGGRGCATSDFSFVR